MEGKITMTELKSIVTIEEVMEINALLDMTQDIEIHNHKKLEKKNR